MTIATRLNNKQRERIARNIVGYNGPMSGFNQFLESDPVKKSIYNNAITQIDDKLAIKKMKAGGVIDNVVADYHGQREYVTGKGFVNTNPAMAQRYEAYKAGTTDIFGDVKSKPKVKQDTPEPMTGGVDITDPEGTSGTSDKSSLGTSDVSASSVLSQVQADVPTSDPTATDPTNTGAQQTVAKATEQQIGDLFRRILKRNPSSGDIEEYKKYEPGQVEKFLLASNEYKQLLQKAPTYTDEEVSKIGDVTEDQKVKFTPIGDEAVSTIEGASPVATSTVTEPTKTAAVTMGDAELTETDVRAEADKLTAKTGVVSNDAQATAQTVTASDTAVKDVNAAKIDQATQVENVPRRTQQADEMVSGPAVKMAEVELALDKAKAAQLDITEDMTIQGQLNKLLTDFDAGSPPPWASGSMRAATAVLNQRGIGASSMAGQAIIQATLESAIPIAAGDAKTIFEAGVQNLSARQQVAVLTAQQRAQFLGQEFDQEFQTRVLNAARVADIADMNFNADVQIALENARLTQTVELANLNNRQALVMAKAAQIANLESANLNNRQQAEIQNAEAFLKMDLTNLNNEQQTALFKSQQIIQSLFTDAAAENARLQFNATTENQVNQFFDSLDTQVKQFNAQQKNGMEQFRVSQENAVAEFNANVENNRLQFNASNGLVVSQANAQWRQQIATIDTAAQNQVNQFNAQNALAVTMKEYENIWQEYRDNIEFAWKSGETALERQNNLAIAQLSKEAAVEAAAMQEDGALWAALGTLGAGMFEGSGSDIVTTFFDWLKSGKQATSGGPSPSTPTGTGSQTGGGSTTVGPGGGGTSGVTVAPPTNTSSTQPPTVDPIDDPNITIGPGGGGTGGVT